jgi:hypothetical protein
MGLIDDAAPTPDAREFHEIEVHASPDVVYRTLWTVNLGASFLIKSLLALRSFPARIVGRRRSFPTPVLTLESVMHGGFGLLAEEPGREMLLGVTGRFWRLTGNVEPFDRASFSDRFHQAWLEGFGTSKSFPPETGKRSFPPKRALRVAMRPAEESFASIGLSSGLSAD